MVASCTGFRFRLNGRDTAISNLSAQTSLLDFIRSQGLTGAKEGCAEGECGACAVLLVDHDPASGTTYRAVNSCLVPLPSMADREVYTVESLADGRGPCEVQRAMAAGGGSQCGYCTPGFVVSMFAEQYRTDDPAERDVHALGGNLCRCTGYRPIQDALKSLGPAPEGLFKQRLSMTAPAIHTLRYETKEGGFSRPISLREALVCFGAEPWGQYGAQYVAGNTDLGVLTNLRGERFRHLISLEAVPELKEFQDTPDYVEIGAGLTLTEIHGLWTKAPSVLNEWLYLFASVLIRNLATLGGSLATASPIGDSAPLLLAMDASLRVASSTGEREIQLTDFFTGYRKTALLPGEILRSVRIPKPFPQKIRFFKVAKRRMDDISTVASCIAETESGLLRIGLGGVAATPVRFEGADAETLRAELPKHLKPMSDHRGSAEYRLAMAKSLLAKYSAWRHGNA